MATSTLATEYIKSSSYLGPNLILIGAHFSPPHFRASPRSRNSYYHSIWKLENEVLRSSCHLGPGSSCLSSRNRKHEAKVPKGHRSRLNHP